MIDATTLAELWDDCADRLLLIARSIGEPADDAVQEAFVALACQRNLPDDPMAWLVRVTRNRLLQWQRSQQRRRRRETLACQSNWFDGESTQIEQQIDARQLTATLMQLTSPQREIIVMHLWGGMSFETIGQILELSRASTHRSFHRGLDTLKRQHCFQTECDSERLCHERT